MKKTGLFQEKISSLPGLAPFLGDGRRDRSLTTRRRRTFSLLLIGIFLLAATFMSFQSPAVAGSERPGINQGLRDRLQREGSVRVIVELALPSGSHTPEARFKSQAAVHSQRAQISKIQEEVLGRLSGKGHRVVHKFRTAPFMALQVDQEALGVIETAVPNIRRVVEDRILAPFLAQSVPLIQGDLAWDFGYDGSGQVIAILDSGVDKTHPFLAGKVVAEACFADGGDCPNGQSSQIGEGAAVPCAFAPDACFHGTHVAGIAAGSGSAFSGVAKGAQLLAIQVFHGSTTECLPFFEPIPCARAFSSDIGAALEHVYEMRTQFPIAAANLSLGGGMFASTCDDEDPLITSQIDNLRAAGIATTVASGNDGWTGNLAFPACVSSSVSVGSTGKDSLVSSFSNVSPLLSLFAPGSSINSSMPGGWFEVMDGTSMAAPHVAGAWAILKQARPEPEAGVTQILDALKETGIPITDDRGTPSVTKPLIQIAAALGMEFPVPVLTGISPAAVNAWGPDFTLTVTGADFARSSVVRVNGINRSTTYVNAATLTALIPASDIASTVGPVITVFTPPPGGGTTAPLTLALRQPVLTVSATTVPVGGQVTVTLTNGPGGVKDWLALAAVGSLDVNYLKYTYVGAGVTTRTWTVTIPTAGTYEFRLFINDGYTRVATSPSVAVSGTLPSSAVLTVNSTAVPVGGQVTVTLTDGPGGARDWLALAAVGSPNANYLQYTYVGAGVTTRTWTVTIPTAGTYEFRLFLNDTYTRVATSPSVAVSGTPPSAAVLTVSSTAVPVGGQVTVTLTNGPGGAKDWLTLAAVGSPNTSYLQYTYVGAGVTTRTWTVTIPTAGTYEFRLFLNDTYTRASTSPSVTVSGTPPSAAVLTVSSTAVPVGGQVTVTLTDGPGGARDWLALAAVGSPNTSYLQFTYVGAGVTNRTWTVTIPTAGTYEFRLFLNDSYTRASTSPLITANP